MDKTQQILDFIKQGNSYADTGRKFTLSRERIRQIANKHYLDIKILKIQNPLKYKKNIISRICAYCFNDFFALNKYQYFCSKECKIWFKIKYGLYSSRYIKINKKILQISHWVIEKSKKRKIRKNEIVHHIDGNPKNNKLSNLRTMTSRAHVKLHNTKYPLDERRKKYNKRAQLRRKTKKYHEWLKNYRKAKREKKIRLQYQEDRVKI